MNSFQITIFVLAVVVGVAFAGTCEEDCDNLCQGNHKTCTDEGEDAQICDSALNDCSQGCDVACVCINSCKDKCEPALNKCLEDNADNGVIQEECRITYANCDNDCQLFCHIGNADQAYAQERQNYNN